MSLSMTELESITKDYFMANGGKAVEIFFKSSFLLDFLMNKEKGIFERPSGGEKIRIPLSYSDAEGGFFTRADALSSDDRVSINAAFFHWKHAYGNATIYQTDELAANGDYGKVQLVTQKAETAQMTCRDKLAKAIYGAGGDESETLTGLLSLTNTTTSRAFGGIAEDDLVASDGTKPWRAVFDTTAEAISLAVLQGLRSAAKISDGADGKPGIGVTTEALYNTVSRILQVQQRFASDEETVKAGFTHLVYEGMILAADDFCPAGHAFALNPKHVGFAIHKDGYFARQPWVDLTGPVGRTMKILWHGNMVCSNRKAHSGHSNLTA